MKKSKMDLNLALVFAVSFVLIAGGCAKKKDDISQVSTDAYLSKADITGCPGGSQDQSCAKTYSMVKTIVSADETLDPLGVIPGFHSDFGFAQFLVTEKELQVRLVGEPNKTPGTATVIASFPITAHFDIKKEKNDFGEETNKIIEDVKTPWDQRAYMRVDFGTNNISTSTLTNIFATTLHEENSHVVSPVQRDGALLSFDTDSSITIQERYDYGNGQIDNFISSPFRAHMKTSFLQVKPSDFQAYEMSNTEFARFGYFRSYENIVNPDKGITLSGQKNWANKFNVCENSAKTAGLSCATNKIVYTVNAGFPDEYLQPAREVVAAWNDTFKKALNRTDDVVVLDESVKPEIGDIRYNMIAGVDEKVPTGLLGVSQTVNNPGTGENLAARASVYLGTVRLEGGMAAEQFDLLVGSATSSQQFGLGKSDQELSMKTGPALLVGKLKARVRAMRKIAGLSVSPSLSPVKAPRASDGNLLRRQVTAPFMVATDRNSNALNKLLSYFDISDGTWNSWNPRDSHLPLEKSVYLKNNLMVGRQAMRDKMLNLSREQKGIHLAEFVEPAVEQYIRKFIIAHAGEPQDQLREKLKSEVRKQVFYTTLIHEMGHNFGLRHNFASSGDKKNYTTKYYDLEKQKQGLAEGDPKRTEIELEQGSYDFTSVMDYTGGFTETIGGTGNYDLAAIRFAYNSSIDKNGDSITGVVRNYKFCTDHQLGEDLLCRQWDKGANVTATSAKAIEDYGVNYYFRNFRRDRYEFGDPNSYFNRVISRTMLPLRQVSDEFIYQFITSPTVAAGTNQCDVGFMRASIEAGEIANICDPSVVQKYTAQGVDTSDWAQFVYFLLTDDMSGFRKDPKTYKSSGFADLIMANYQVSNFLVDVLGTPEPGSYFPIQNDQGSYDLEPIPAVSGSDDDRLMAYLTAKGVSQSQAQQLIPQIRDNIVDLKPGPDAKYLLSKAQTDGVFKNTMVMGHLFDKLAAVIIMGARGLPVEKYQELSLNTNMYFSPQTKTMTSSLINALVNNNTAIATKNLKTRSGADIVASVPASLNLNTQYYGTIIGLSDLVSDQNQEFADKMRVCSKNDLGCSNDLQRAMVSFKGANGQDEFRAVQVSSGDSVAYQLVAKGQAISQQRDKFFKDVQGKATLISQAKGILSGAANASTRETALMDLIKAKAPSFVVKATAVYGNGAKTLWGSIVAQAQDIENADPNSVYSIQQTLAASLAKAQTDTKTALAKDPAALKEVLAAASLVEKDMTDLNDLTFRVSASQILVDQASTQLQPIEADAKFLRSMRLALGVD